MKIKFDKKYKVTLNLLFLFVLVLPAKSQTLKWAQHLDSNNYNVNAIVNDDLGNVYSAYNDGAGSTAITFRTGEVRLYSHNWLGTLKWEKTFAGTGHIFDMLVKDGKLYVLGIIKDSIQIDSQWIFPLVGQQYRSFILSMDTSGIFQWVAPTAWAENNMLVNLEINNQTIYTVGLFDNVQSRLDSWDMIGNHLQSKIFDELRSLSDIEFDSMNNLYLAGTGNPNGTMDTIQYTNSTPSSSYLIFLIKLNPNWQAQWINLEPFITFDFSPQIEIIDDTIFHAYLNDFALPTSQMNVEIQSFNVSGQSLIVQNTAESNGNFHFTSTTDFGVKKLMVAKQDYYFKPVYIHLFNTELIETRTDSIYKLSVESMRLAGGINEYSVALSTYDSLSCNNQFAFDLSNPNFIQSNITLCVSSATLELTKLDKLYTVNLFPNPVFETLHVTGLKGGKNIIRIFDAMGKEYSVHSHQQGDELLIDVSNFSSGIYFLLDETNSISSSFLIE